MATGFVGLLKSPFNWIVRTAQESSQVARDIYNTISGNVFVSTITGLAKFCFVGFFEALTWVILRRRYVEPPQRRHDLGSICKNTCYGLDRRASPIPWPQQVTVSVPSANCGSRVPTDVCLELASPLESLLTYLREPSLDPNSS